MVACAAWHALPVEALSWVSDWLDAVAETTEALRDEADAMIKLLGHGRALTATAEEVAPV